MASQEKLHKVQKFTTKKKRREKKLRNVRKKYIFHVSHFGKGCYRKRGKSKSLSKLIVWIWLRLSQGLKLPIPTLRRLKEGLTEWFADRQTNKTARSKAQAKTPESSQGNIKECYRSCTEKMLAQREHQRPSLDKHLGIISGLFHDLKHMI